MSSPSVGRCLLLFCTLACSGAESALSQIESRPPSEQVLVTLGSGDSVLIAVRTALVAGEPWKARRLLDSRATGGLGSTERILLSAAAAAALNEWSRVERLLGQAGWADSLGEGLGRVLLAKAALERRADSTALEHAEVALRHASGGRFRGERWLLRARALDRLNRRDSAHAAYDSAAALLPEIADWLRLRAAGVARDSAVRSALFSSVQSTVARDRIRWTEALARERAGDIAGAARVYEDLRARPSVLRMQLILAGRDSTERAGLRDTLLRELRADSSDARTLAELLDQIGGASGEQELIIARTLASSGPLSRAATAYARAFASGAGTSADRVQYGVVLSRLGRDREAASMLATVSGASPAAVAARYNRARSLLRLGQLEPARAIFRVLLRDFPSDTSTARAMFLLADLAADEGRDAAARTTYRDMARSFGGHTLAPAARFRAAIIAFASGDYRAAAVELDSLWTVHRSSEEALAAGYWSGRAWAMLGDQERARARWREIIVRSPLSYYAATSARRLGESPWAPPAPADSVPRIADVDAAVRRARLLDALDMSTEAELEYAHLDREAEREPARGMPTAAAYASQGLAWRGARLAARMLSRAGPSDARMYRLAYPLPYRDVLVGEATRAGVEPALVAAIIRQESGFNPRATSVAGARGLMQIMPSVGEQIARGMRIPDWSSALLYQPEVSLSLGTRHLRAALGQRVDLPRALAAYNAGGSRAARWSGKGGSADPELFIERISFPETRDYVRIVLRNRDLYEALYE